MGYPNISLISARLRELRQSKDGLTQDELAEKLGISVQIVRNYEAAGENKGSGKVPRAPAGMKLETLYKYAEFFKVSADWILGLSDVRSLDPNVQMVCEATGLCEDFFKRTLRYCYKNDSMDEVNYVLESNAFRYLIHLLHSLKIAKDKCPAIDPDHDEDAKVHKEYLTERGYFVGDFCEYQRQQSSFLPLVFDSLFDGYLSPINEDDDKWWTEQLRKSMEEGDE